MNEVTACLYLYQCNNIIRDRYKMQLQVVNNISWGLKVIELLLKYFINWFHRIIIKLSMNYRSLYLYKIMIQIYFYNCMKSNQNYIRTFATVSKIAACLAFAPSQSLVYLRLCCINRIQLHLHVGKLDKTHQCNVDLIVVAPKCLTNWETCYLLIDHLIISSTFPILSNIDELNETYVKCSLNVIFIRSINIQNNNSLRLGEHLIL